VVATAAADSAQEKAKDQIIFVGLCNSEHVKRMTHSITSKYNYDVVIKYSEEVNTRMAQA